VQIVVGGGGTRVVRAGEPKPVAAWVRAPEYKYAPGETGSLVPPAPTDRSAGRNWQRNINKVLGAIKAQLPTLARQESDAQYITDYATRFLADISTDGIIGPKSISAGSEVDSILQPVKKKNPQLVPDRIDRLPANWFTRRDVQEALARSAIARSRKG
jgi:hypothetical protein